MNKYIKSFLAIGACVAMTCSGYAKESTDITDFFVNHLNGDASAFQSSKTLKLKEIPSVRQTVWADWVKANSLYDEEKLPEIAPLSEENKYKWNLPADLEPNAVMNFYWGSKGDSISSDGYPMFLYMHGSGPRDREWATGIKICSAFDDAPSAYFIPQIPNEGEHYRWWHKSKQYAWNRLLRQALASGKIDPNRIYFFGISEGGYGSQRLASFYADYLAAAGPMAGGEPLINAPAENLRNTAFSLRTGDQDFGFYREKLTRYTAAELDSLKKLHPDSYTHWVDLIPGMGHSIDYRPTTPWMKQFERNPYPRHVTWENMDMDGWYRDGFYNLYVTERSNDDTSTRTVYDMDITDNTVDIKVDLVKYETVEVDDKWGIALKFKKSHTPAEKGKFIVYLNDKLVDLKKPVTVTVNGREVYKGKLKLELANMVNSCAAFFDPERIYPAAVTVDLSK